MGEILRFTVSRENPIITEKTESDRELVDKLLESISIVHLEDFILSHEELSKQPQTENADNVFSSFRKDIKKGDLDRYRGSWVIYQKGIFCGQSKHRDLLWNKAGRYYGYSGLTMFFIPIEEDKDSPFLIHSN